MLSGIYVITDEGLIPGRTHAEIARAALAGGAAVIQLRDKSASDEYLIEAGREIRRLTSEAGALFIVNDRLDVALACGADGLHVGQSDSPACELRPLLMGKLLGVSVLNAEQAAKARADGADHLGVGPIFATATKPDADPPTGLDAIMECKHASGGLPIVAIGGISESNLAEVKRAGADSAAIISAIVCADDMVAATRRLVRIWCQAP
jgi:thiamine-phosphate pyrophosphorylase